MVDTYDDPLVYVLPKPATVPEGDITQAEWDDLLAAYNDLLAAYNTLDLDDLGDVDTTGASDGSALVFDIGTGLWGPGEVSGGIPTITDGGVPINTVPVVDLWANAGLTAEETTPGQVDLSVVFAGTGSETTVSRSDHSHSAAVFGIDTGVATGTLSSGTRVLASTTTATLASGITYDVEGTAIVRARNNVNSGTCNLLFRIGADASYPQRSRNVQTVGGVPVDQIIHFTAVLVGAGAGAAVTFSVQFSTGDAVDLRDHEIIVKCHPRR